MPPCKEQAIEEHRKRGRWWQRHPGCFMLVAAMGFAVVALAGTWLYLKLTIPGRIEAELRAAGIPLTQEELDAWDRPSPAEDGTAAYLSAIAEFKKCQTRFGEEEYSRLIDEFPSKDKQEELPVDFARREREFVRANHKRFAALSAVMRPAVEQIRQAADYPVFTFGSLYENLTQSYTDFHEHWGYYRLFAIYLHRQIQFDVLSQKSPKEVYQSLRLMRDLSCKPRIYTFTECLVNLAVSNITFSALAAALEKQALSARELRDLGAPFRLRQSNDQHRIFSVECSFVHAVFLQHPTQSLCYRTAENSGLPLLRLRYYLLVDFEHLDTVRHYLSMRNLERKSFRDDLAEVKRCSTLLAQAESPLSIAHYYPYREATWDPALSQHLLHADYRLRTLNNLAFLVCELAARGREGKPLPQTLETTEFPADPFTGKPFRLESRDGALILSSPGQDLKFDPLPVDLSRSGIRRQHGKEDDIVFVLSRRALTPATPSPAAPTQ